MHLEVEAESSSSGTRLGQMVTLEWYNNGDLVCHSLNESKGFFKRTDKPTPGVEQGMIWFMRLPKTPKVIRGKRIFNGMEIDHSRD
jgi:hypothetical protein